MGVHVGSKGPVVDLNTVYNLLIDMIIETFISIYTP